MNHDEQNPNLEPWIAPELEARVVAAVLGEASAFERAELERLIADNPELGVFKRRLEAVHGLVAQAVRPDQAPMRLAPERRAKILAAIGATAARPTEGERNTPVLLELAAARKKRRVRWMWLNGIAASLTLAAVLVVTLRPSREFGLLKVKEEAAAPSVSRLEMPLIAAEAESDAEMTFSAPRAVQSDSFSAPFQMERPQPVVPSRPRLLDVAKGVVGGVTRSAAEPTFDYYNRAEKKHEAGLANLTLSAEGRALGAVKFGTVPQPGNRSRSELKDVGSAVSVVDKQFLNDVGGTGAKSFAYAGNANAGGGGAQRGAAPGTSWEEPIVLERLDVSAPSDEGYRATATLAGSRVASNVGALPAPASPDLAGQVGRLIGDQASAASAFDPNDGFLSSVARQNAVAELRVGEDSARAVDEVLSKEKAQKAATAARAEWTQSDSSRAEVSVAAQPVSTFSLHVSDVSFKLAQTALARGELPDPERIRPEEFYNAFDYGDPAPTASEKIACRIEQSAHPFLQQRNLVRIAMRVPAAGRAAGQPLRLTVLLDTSGSMEREDRTASVRSALGVLGSMLGADDRVTLIGFARRPRLLAEQVPGDQAARLAAVAAATPFAGGTNLEEALKLAGELARRHRQDGAQNRIVLLTDGAANLGSADPDRLAALVTTLRQQGIAFDACGVGTDGLDDSILEALTRKGDGRYYVLDKPEDADAGFARQLAGAFRPAAENVKVQVRFNPARVAHYRLIGFEQHRLREEDFRNDQVDAAELAADEAAVAVYQVEVIPDGEGELGNVAARFRDAATGVMVEQSWTLRHEPRAPAFDRASPAMQLAGTAALLAEKLQGGEAAKLIDLAQLAGPVNALRGHYRDNARVQELVAMYDQLRRRAG